MKKYIRLLFVPSILSLVIAAPVGCIAKEQEQEYECPIEECGDLWFVKTTDGAPADSAHFIVEELLRLKITPKENKVMFTPIGSMANRLDMKNVAGGTTRLRTVLLERVKKSPSPYYCGHAIINHNNGPQRHEIALSIVGPNWVILNFDPIEPGNENRCGQNVSHGGWAHIHR